LINFPKKRLSVGALLTNAIGEILIVNPNYRNGWLLPGGVVDADESPVAALMREVEEELGLALRPQRLLCVDYTSRNEHYEEGIHLLFDCGALTDEQISCIRLCDKELVEWLFCSPETAKACLVPSLALRLAHVGDGGTVYLENGIRTDG
jgi:ADP-ribose pyrophosphatase YjhB (NUDIX family)